MARKKQVCVTCRATVVPFGVDGEDMCPNCKGPIAGKAVIVASNEGEE